MFVAAVSLSAVLSPRAAVALNPAPMHPLPPHCVQLVGALPRRPPLSSALQWAASSSSLTVIASTTGAYVPAVCLLCFAACPASVPMCCSNSRSARNCAAAPRPSAAASLPSPCYCCSLMTGSELSSPQPSIPSATKKKGSMRSLKRLFSGSGS